MNEIAADRRFSINFPLLVHAKLVNPEDFEKVNSITKVSINITES
jgi:hypothetical protein